MVWNKKLKRFSSRIAGALALTSIVWFGGIANAQVKVGIIDESELAEGYTTYKKAKEDLDARLQKLDAQVPARQWLDPNSTARFDVLIKKDSLTTIENTELTKLVESGLNRNNRYIKIAAQPSRTAAEEAEFKKIEEDVAKNRQGTRALQDELQQAMQTRDETLDKDYTNKALGIIKQIAEKRELQVVLRKAAVVWNSDAIDITKEAIEMMNK